VRRRRIPNTRRIHQNIWGNWNGYKGRRKVVEFGTDAVAAGAWCRTGECPRCGAPVKWGEREAYCQACVPIMVHPGVAT
jgi:hypothetical protein